MRKENALKYENSTQDKGIVDGLISYWNERSESYSAQNIEEMSDFRKDIWRKLILAQAPKEECLHILDVGTGPGFFAINLSMAGHRVSAVDITEDMLRHAAENASVYGADVEFLQYNGRELPFDDAVFELVISRNVLWNIDEPFEALREWKRVLKKGGRMVYFDANWYLYLFDEKQRERHEESHRLLHEQYPDEIHDLLGPERAAYLEDIARRLPLSCVKRPEWDVQALRELDMRLVTLDPDLNDRIYSGSDLIHYAATPEFMICAEKMA